MEQCSAKYHNADLFYNIQSNHSIPVHPTLTKARNHFQQRMIIQLLLHYKKHLQQHQKLLDEVKGAPKTLYPSTPIYVAQTYNNNNNKRKYHLFFL